MEGNKDLSNLQHTTNEMLVTIDAAERDEIICCIVVPNTLLLDLSTKTWESLSLVSCINEHVVDEALLLNPECARLELFCVKQTGGIAICIHPKVERLKNSTRFAVYRAECLSALELKRASRVP